MIELHEPACVYCKGPLKLFRKDAYHPAAPGHGPFDVYLCRNCGSLMTFPLPSPGQMRQLYSGFSGGMIHEISELRQNYPLTTWYRQCVDSMRKNMARQQQDFSWMDVGAGDGVVSEMMKTEFPGSTGLAVDFHERPPRLAGMDIGWDRVDLNDASALQGSFDLVFAITVFEHMLYPGQFLQAMVRLLKPGGLLYFNCPRTDAFAFRAMGRKWPYYLPGEHITIPSMKGLNMMADSIFRGEQGTFTIKVNPVIMPYPLGYYLGYYLGISRKLSFDMDLCIPTGLLEAFIHRQD